MDRPLANEQIRLMVQSVKLGTSCITMKPKAHRYCMIEGFGFGYLTIVWKQFMFNTRCGYVNFPSKAQVSLRSYQSLIKGYQYRTILFFQFNF